jgi:hypothetical protein
MAMISLRVSQATFRLFTYWLVVHCTGGHMYTVTCTVHKESSYVGKNQEVIYTRTYNRVLLAQHEFCLGLAGEYYIFQ